MNIEDLSKLTKDELLAVAEQFGTDVKPSITKKDLLGRLEEDGITAELYNNYQKDAEDYDAKELGLHPLTDEEREAMEESDEAPVEDDEPDLVLIKMTRPNGTFQIRGVTFKRDHPFALMSEDDADYVIEVVGGFRLASPKEAKNFYS